MIKFKYNDWLFKTIFVVGLSCFFILKLAIPIFYEMLYLKKAEIVENNLIELRVALEKYYQISGKYPELSKEGASEDLSILDYTNEQGQVISFAKIYGKKSLCSTEKTDSLEESNKVIDSNNFKNIDGSGGWIYDYSNQSGEIHPNLLTNVYFQNIDWSEQ